MEKRWETDEGGGSEEEREKNGRTVGGRGEREGRETGCGWWEWKRNRERDK